MKCTGAEWIGKKRNRRDWPVIRWTEREVTEGRREQRERTKTERTGRKPEMTELNETEWWIIFSSV